MKCREVLKVVTDELDRRHIDYRLEHGKKHLKVMFVYDGAQRIVALTRSTKNQARLPNNMRTNMRRIFGVP